MDRRTFQERLREAGRCATRFARDYVWQPLPDEVAYRVYPNMSHDDNPRVGDEVVYPADSLSDGEFLGPWSDEETVEYLWRGGMVPEWIDASVESEDGSRTLVGLRCCGRFSASEELHDHRPAGLSPFSIKSPDLPPEWESVGTNGRFDLNWRQQHSSGRA